MLNEHPITYGSVCSGIEAAMVAWEPLGWEPAWFAEVEPFCNEVLAHHYPGVTNHGDFTQILDADPIDLLVGGTPCQSFSVAGARAGLDDPRGNLALEFLGLAHRLRPRWIVWENAFGVLSSNEGRDFGAIIGALGKLGYGWAYRILDAQYFGVPQRRRKVFVVGHLGDWRRAAAVLLERESLSRDSAPRREARASVAAPLTRGSSSDGVNAPGRRREDDVNLVAHSLRGQANASHRADSDTYVAHALNAKGAQGRMDGESETFVAAPITAGYAKGSGVNDGKKGSPQNLIVSHFLRAEGFDASEDGTGRGTPIVFMERTRSKGRTLETMVGTSYTLCNPGSGGRTQSRQVLDSHLGVRRLTCLECERLQGFPDFYTLIDRANGKPAADGPRYRALGNSMAVPVMRWIGRRIQIVEGID